MGLARISLQNFRCFVAAELEFEPSLNLITGNNASGKTSLIEAVYLLGRGRSFRAANLESVVRTGADGFKIHGDVSNSATQLPLELAYRHRRLQAKIAGHAPESLARLSETFPIQLVDNQSHLLIGGGPRYRRQFLDWGVFHVEPAFFPAWHKYQRTLQQRNALLRNSKSQKGITGWDEELSSHGESLDRMRRAYLAQLAPTAGMWTRQALGGVEIQFEYRPGWPEELTLAEALQHTIHKDCATGTTSLGPHRADILITVNGKIAHNWISKGQEKVLAGSLLLAQALVYRLLAGRSCTLLLDDLPSELDDVHLQRFLERVNETGAQTLITAIEAGTSIANNAAKLFHVEQGRIM